MPAKYLARDTKVCRETSKSCGYLCTLQHSWVHERLCSARSPWRRSCVLEGSANAPNLWVFKQWNPNAAALSGAFGVSPHRGLTSEARSNAAPSACADAPLPERFAKHLQRSLVNFDETLPRYVRYERYERYKRYKKYWKVQGAKRGGRTEGMARLVNGMDVNACYQCGKCSAGCPVYFAMDILPHQMLRLLQIGEVDQVLDCESIWLCTLCSACSTRCPRGVDLPAIIEELRRAGLRRESGRGRSQRAFHN
ncbi:succinate dehydrogenase iron-sulfur subunit [Peptococcaceae bacterium CEB3]|nr:succinate dehydrogenase iron-sulfur subunit [Peptococcaceae bacterium CEB3]